MSTINLILALSEITNEVPDGSASTVWMCFTSDTFNQGITVMHFLLCLDLERLENEWSLPR